MKDFRKYLFINSQYCTYYIDQKQTVAAGILRNKGYKYSEKFSDEKIDELNKLYRKYTTILNCCVGAEIILYLYFVFFPFYIQFLQMFYFTSVMAFSIPPLVALYLTYVVINKFYEKDLEKFGSFECVKFKPNLYNVEPQAFDKYLNTKRKSWIVLLLVSVLFIGYAYAPILINILNDKENYKLTKKFSNVYLKLVPISADVYAQRAYAEYKLQEYKSAVKDYELANLYSDSSVYDFDILGVKVEDLSFEEMKIEFDKAIEKAQDENTKRFLLYEKSIFLYNNKDYKETLKIYNKLIEDFDNKKDAGFSPENVYHYRSIIRDKLGDKEGAKKDRAMADKMCPKCKFEMEIGLITLP